MEIEIYSDVVCPWCYLGRRRLDAALATFDGEVTLRWRAFQLDPDLPRDGRPLLGWLAARYGGVVKAKRAMEQVAALARAEGLHLDFERALIANTFDAHRLLWYADQPEAVFFGAHADTQAELADTLQRAHFTDGLDLSSPAVLVELADEVGLDARRVSRLLSTNEGTADVRGEIARAHDLGITSVPTFILAGRYAVTGAQGVAALRSALAEVARREGMAPVLGAFVPRQRGAHACEDDALAA